MDAKASIKTKTKTMPVQNVFRYISFKSKKNATPVVSVFMLPMLNHYNWCHSKNVHKLCETGRQKDRKIDGQTDSCKNSCDFCRPGCQGLVDTHKQSHRI